MFNTEQKECKIIEGTVCFDMYMEQSYNGKLNSYNDLKAALIQARFTADYYVMCFGSLRCVHVDVRGNLRKLAWSTSLGHESNNEIVWSFEHDLQQYHPEESLQKSP